MEKVLLIIDDSKEIVEVVENILGGLFDRIVTAASVSEALEKVKDNVFSFIILDINLEGRNGAEVIKYLMDNPENENNATPVIILSGIINEQFIERNSSRFAGVLMKPFDHDQLLRTVKDELEQEIFGEPVGISSIEADNEDFPEPPFDLPFAVPELKNKVKNVIANMKKNSKLKQLFAEIKIDRGSDNYIMSHIGILINVSTYICQKLDWSTEKTLEKYIFAAYLHDMALAHRPDLARIHGSMFEVELVKEKLSPADFKLILEHPNMAAKKIDEILDIPADVGIIVRQHHELPKENGFPAKIGHTKITPLSSVFIVAHDLTDFILEHPNWTIQEFMTKAKAKYKGQYFAKVLSVLNEM
jgi:response regulator RpfG family c-di-GMP phosphodiesterase